MKYYLHCGHIKRSGGKSRSHSVLQELGDGDNAKGRESDCLPVYPLEFVTDGVWRVPKDAFSQIKNIKIFLEGPCRSLLRLGSFERMYLYLVTGEESCNGHDGEPCLLPFKCCSMLIWKDKDISQYVFKETDEEIVYAE